MDPQLKEKARRAIDAGLHYLRGAAGRERLAVGLGRDHRAGAARLPREPPRLQRGRRRRSSREPVEFILSKVNDDGSISETLQNRSYNTAVALTALAATKNPKYAGTIANAPEIPEGRTDQQEEKATSPDHRCCGQVVGSRRRQAARHVEHVRRARRPEGDCRKILKDPVWQTRARVRGPLTEPQPEATTSPGPATTADSSTCPAGTRPNTVAARSPTAA